MNRLNRETNAAVMEGLWLWKLLYKLHLLSREDYNSLKGLM